MEKREFIPPPLSEAEIQDLYGSAWALLRWNENPANDISQVDYSKSVEVPKEASNNKHRNIWFMGIDGLLEVMMSDERFATESVKTLKSRSQTLKEFFERNPGEKTTEDMIHEGDNVLNGIIDILGPLTPENGDRPPTAQQN